MNPVYPVRSAVGATAIHLLQVTPYIVTAGLIARSGMLPVLGAVLVLAAGVLLSYNSTRAFLSTRASGAKARDGLRPPSTLLLAVYLMVGAIEWFALFWMIRTVGPTASILVMVGSGIATMWASHMFMLADHHRVASFTHVAAAIVLVGVAAAVMSKSQLTSIDLANTSDLLTAMAAVALCIVCTVVDAMLKAMLTDERDTNARRRRPIKVDTLICAQLVVAAAAMVGANWWHDGGQQLLALVPEHVLPCHWTRDHWGLIWLGVVNTAFGLVAATRLSNTMGLPIATSIGQCRPVMSELMLVAIGTTTITVVSAVDLLSASVLLITASIVLSYRPPSSAGATTAMA